MQFKVLRLFVELETKLNITHYSLFITHNYCLCQKNREFQISHGKNGDLM